MSDMPDELPPGFEWRADVDTRRLELRVALHGPGVDEREREIPLGVSCRPIPVSWTEAWLEDAITACARIIWDNIGRAVRVGNKLGVGILVH